MTAPDDQQTGEYTEPPDEVRQALQCSAAISVSLSVTAAQTMLDTLHHVDEFLRQAGPVTQAELRAFCATQGWSPTGGAGVLIDRVGLHALILHSTITSATNDIAADAVSNHDKESV